VPPGFPSAAIRQRNADLFIGRGASEAEARQVIRAYLAAISWVDWNVGRVLAELDRLGLRENTIVVYVCDHGYQLGEKGKWSKAGSLFEMGTRVPLIISAPGHAGNGTSSPRIVQSLDIYPTLAELCGLPQPAELEGASLAPLLRAPAASWAKPAFSIWSEDGKTIHGTAVRTEQWRYAEYGPDGANGALLFDPHADPLEMTNLAREEKEGHKKRTGALSAIAKMRERLAQERPQVVFVGDSLVTSRVRAERRRTSFSDSRRRSSRPGTRRTSDGSDTRGKTHASSRPSWREAAGKSENGPP